MTFPIPSPADKIAPSLTTYPADKRSMPREGAVNAPNAWLDKDDTQGRVDEVTDEPVATNSNTTAEGGRQDLEAIYSWLPPGAFELFISEYLRTGNSSVAWAAIRADSRYEQWFPGNRLEDGRVRYSEEEYSKIVAAYDDALIGVGVNPDLYRDRYGDLIRGEVSPYEFENERIMPIYERIVLATDQIQDYYSRMYGLGNLSTGALIAAALDPSVGDAVLNQQLTLAEIGGEAMESGYDFSVQRVEELAAAGMDRSTADSLFTDAARVVPILDTLARRHYDPDDDFDVEEFLSAEFFNDPAENRRMRRLISQDRATFRDQVATRTSATGALTGLTAQ